MQATLGRLKRPPQCCFGFRTLAVTVDRRRRAAHIRAVLLAVPSRRTRALSQKRLGSRSFGFLARLPNRRCTHLALVGHFLIIEKLEDHDIRAPILGMGREVAISRRIPVLVKPRRTVTIFHWGLPSTSHELQPPGSPFVSTLRIPTGSDTCVEAEDRATERMSFLVTILRSLT